MVCVKWPVVVMAVVVVVGEAKQYCTYQPTKPSPPSQPEIALQYTAKTESVHGALSENNETITIVSYDEWVYDAPRNRIAIQTSSKLAKHVHLMDWNTHQMLILSSSKEVGKFDDCIVRPVTEALPMFSAIDGAGQELSPDQIPDPGVPLGILNWTNAQYKGEFSRRDIPSYRWEWCGLHEYEGEMGVQTISMASYWSVPSWNMPIPTDQKLSVPLGWEVIVWGKDDTDYYSPSSSNIMYYEPGLVDELAFRISSDIYCPDMVAAKGHPFPDLSQDTFFSFSLEYEETDAKSFAWADAWYDFEKKLYRVDHDVTPPSGSTFTTSTSTTNIVTTTLLLDYNDGVAFEFVPGTLTECRVSLLSGARGDWSDLTGLNHLWGDSPSSFFGSDMANYTYYGPGVERYMVIDDWRGLRADWPPNALMLWQWSFTNKNVSTVSNFGDHIYVEKQVPIGVRVTARNNINTTDGIIPEGYSFLYTIYDFEVSEVGKNVEFNGIRVFDAYDCYSPNWREDMRFKLDLTSWPEVVDEPLLTSTYLNEYWQVILANYGKVSPIRITRVQTIIEEADEVWVAFVLLYRHYRIGELDSNLFKNMTTGAEAIRNLTSAVNNGNIKYEGQRPDGEDFVLLAVHGSLTTVVEPECTTTTSTTTTSTATSANAKTTTTTTTTPSPHMTTTTPSSHKTTTATTSTPETTTPGGGGSGGGLTLYTPGDLAGLGIGMLLMGFALGAGGTFLVVFKGVHHTIMGCCKKG